MSVCLSAPLHWLGLSKPRCGPTLSLYYGSIGPPIALWYGGRLFLYDREVLMTNMTQKIHKSTNPILHKYAQIHRIKRKYRFTTTTQEIPKAEIKKFRKSMLWCLPSRNGRECKMGSTKKSTTPKKQDQRAGSARPVTFNI
jgi:hypothetical protein